LSDYFLTVKRNPEKFYDKYVKEKASNKLNGSDIKTEISGNNISFDVDDERRSLRITVRCSTANSHKATSLIIKEFELILSKFEEDFASVGFRVYYVLPKIMKLGNDDAKLESYEFGAYIPRLIPLLAGNNIYSEPETFARELIQNSIDAIKVREKRESEDIRELRTIDLEIQEGSDDFPGYFKITDEGTGMNRYVLERYLTTIGRSFYTSSDYKNLRVNYSPISQFGIGFLSCFMLGKHVEVNTTYFENTSETFSLDIPNYDGCYFIESKKTDKFFPGSRIKIWENMDLRRFESHKFEAKRIIDYIKKVILDIPFDIFLENELLIPKYSFRKNLKCSTKINKLLFFIPIAPNPTENGETIIQELFDETKVNEVEHGIYFYKQDTELYDEQKNIVMNNGILIRYSQIFDELHDISPYLDIAFNLPSHALELTVSRDQLIHIKGFDFSLIKQPLTERINKYLESEEVKSLEYAIWIMLDRNNYDLSKISLRINGKMLVVEYAQHNLIDEINSLSDLYNVIDSLVLENNGIKHDNKHAYRISSDSYLHNVIFDFDYSFNPLMENDVDLNNEESIENFFNLIQKRILFNESFDILEYMRDINDNSQVLKSKDRFLSKVKFITGQLTTIIYAKYTYIELMKRYKYSNMSTKISIINLACFKIELSILFTYNELINGIEIPINKIIDKFYKLR
jgi:hypothetical protein